ncbi:sigma-54-dependent transcriptional regulator [Carboxylicivirga caseinilyticus]|uniref:sigma-54-dependent transcriptional regulator n=1 Tax=Carboxylicivirga caseinilyticus TaxID=3417572 RepID=UPI003D34D32C|nr:sigma-54-dependent Fis family transcriptional regulator [Marinilabiliaceae bacterium A049]
MGKSGNVLVVEKDKNVLQWIEGMLKDYVKKVITAKTPCQIPKIVHANIVDVVVLPFSCNGDCIDIESGVRVLHYLLKVNPDAKVVFLVSPNDLSSAVKVMKEGAADVISNRFEHKELINRVLSFVKETSSKGKELSHHIFIPPKREFIYHSEKMREVVRTIDKVAPSEANVLILGENGTGKELVANSIHQKSKRSDKIFISVDMGAFNESLIENELFGHKKGSYTDARNDKVGRFEMADGGTIFLDEIGNLDIAVQAKLLTVLEKREVTRIGDNTSKPIDIRLVSATNKSLHKMVDDSEFRTDLLYRLNTVEIELPPLRDRQEDIPVLVSYFLSMYCALYRKPLLKIEKSAITCMQNYDWPGNVRELQHVIEKSVILAEGDRLTKEELCQRAHIKDDDEISFSSYNLEDVEREVINKVLRLKSGNLTHTADVLGLTRASLYRRLRKYQL